MADFLNILVVDDNALNRKLLCAQLEAEGHAPLEAADGLDALVRLDREPVDAIISDILMPRMDGFRLCREVRQSDKFSALPFILYTSTYNSPADRRLAQTVGADSYLIKPAPTSAILGALREAARQVRVPAPRQASEEDEAYVLKQYNEALVHKLEQKNAEVEEALEKLRLAHDDILELNRDLELRVQQRTAELQAANQELESFSYSVSHDLRAPLRHMQGYVHMLRNALDGQLSEKASHYLQTIGDASLEMGRLIDDLLAFSRMSRAELHETCGSLDEYVRETIKRSEMETQGRNIIWKIPPLPPVLGDPSLIRQVLANLIGNAVKYSRQCDPAEIEVGCAGEEDGRVILFIRDNGAGFDMRYVHKLFGVFQRLHRADEFEGTGVGLAIVRRVIGRHGGRTWAEGKVGEGATFYFTLKPARSGMVGDTGLEPVTSCV